MTRAVLFASIVLGCASLAVGYAQPSGWGAASSVILLFGAAWLLAEARGWRFAAAFGLTLSFLAAAAGLLLEYSRGWMFSSALFALIAWDLAGFLERMRLASPENDRGGMEKRHLLRLGILAAFSALAASLAMTVHWQPRFGWLVLFAFVAALGLTQLVAWIRRKKGE